MRSRAVVGLAFCVVAGCGDDDSSDPGDGGPLLDASVDASSTLDAFVPDAGCGVWVRSNFKDRPPANATPYGIEYNESGTYNQYVCRFRDKLDGKSFVLQGKGVYSYSCYAILPASRTDVAQVQPSDDFEVLTQTESCARMVPFREDQSNGRWLPTGTDVDGNPTYTCHGVVRSLDGGVMETSMPLGRYEPESKRCVFEWYSTVRAAPAPNSTESFEMLAVP